MAVSGGMPSATRSTPSSAAIHVRIRAATRPLPRRASNTAPRMRRYANVSKLVPWSKRNRAAAWTRPSRAAARSSSISMRVEDAARSGGRAHRCSPHDRQSGLASGNSCCFSRNKYWVECGETPKGVAQNAGQCAGSHRRGQEKLGWTRPPGGPRILVRGQDAGLLPTGRSQGAGAHAVGGGPAAAPHPRRSSQQKRPPRP